MPRFFHAFKRPELEFCRDAVRLGIRDLLDFPGGGTRWIESSLAGQFLDNRCSAPHGQSFKVGRCQRSLFDQMLE